MADELQAQDDPFTPDPVTGLPRYLRTQTAAFPPGQPTDPNQGAFLPRGQTGPGAVAGGGGPSPYELLALDQLSQMPPQETGVSDMSFRQFGKSLIAPLAVGLLSSLVYPKYAGRSAGLGQGITAGTNAWLLQQQQAAARATKAREDAMKRAEILAHIGGAAATREQTGAFRQLTLEGQAENRAMHHEEAQARQAETAQYHADREADAIRNSEDRRLTRQDQAFWKQRSLDIQQENADTKKQAQQAKEDDARQSKALSAQMSKTFSDEELQKNPTLRMAIAGMASGAMTVKEAMPILALGVKDKETADKLGETIRNHDLRYSLENRKVSINEQVGATRVAANEANTAATWEKVHNLESQGKKLDNELEYRGVLAAQYEASGTAEDLKTADAIRAGAPLGNVLKGPGGSGKLRKVEYFDQADGSMKQAFLTDQQIAAEPQKYTSPGGAAGRDKEGKAEQIKISRDMASTIREDFANPDIPRNMTVGEVIKNFARYGSYRAGGPKMSVAQMRRITDISAGFAQFIGMASKTSGSRASAILSKITPHFVQPQDTMELALEKLDRLDLTMDYLARAIGWEGGVKDKERLDRIEKQFKLSGTTPTAGLDKLIDNLPRAQLGMSAEIPLRQGETPAAPSGATQAPGLTKEQLDELNKKYPSMAR